ncbi:MAG: helix-turn-helix domain-containing protein [Flavonifractor plautii]
MKREEHGLTQEQLAELIGKSAKLYRAVGARPVHGEHPHAKAAGQCAFTGRKSDFL